MLGLFNGTLNDASLKLQETLGDVADKVCPKYKITQLNDDKLIIDLADKLQADNLNLHLKGQLERKKIWIVAGVAWRSKLSGFAVLLPENMADALLTEAMNLSDVQDNADLMISEDVQEKRVSLYGPFNGYKFLFIVLPTGQGYDEIVQTTLPNILYDIRANTIESDKKNSVVTSNL